MKNNLKIEVVISSVLVILTLLLLNPFHFWMPNMIHMTILASTLVFFALLAVFIIREKTIDERDGVHRMLAGRMAFLIGAGGLIVGIVYQSYEGNLDIWLVVVLVAMVLTKISTRLYSDRRN
jgi:predicted MFS family arabinose efflux permease